MNSSIPISIIKSTTIDLATASETNITIATDNDLKPVRTNVSLNTCTCANALKQADFYFEIANESIANISVKLMFYSLIPENACSENIKIKQTFSVTYITTSYVFLFMKFLMIILLCCYFRIFFMKSLVILDIYSGNL